MQEKTINIIIYFQHYSKTKPYRKKYPTEYEKNSHYTNGKR